jgi:hypothetical protein
LALFLSALFFRIKLYLLAADSILAPSTYCTSSEICPISRIYHDYLYKQIIDMKFQMVAAKAVDCAVGGILAAAEPYVVMNVLFQRFLYLTARIQVIHISIKINLQQHSRVVWGRST